MKTKCFTFYVPSCTPSPISLVVWHCNLGNSKITRPQKATAPNVQKILILKQTANRQKHKYGTRKEPVTAVTIRSKFVITFCIHNNEYIILIIVVVGSGYCVCTFFRFAHVSGRCQWCVCGSFSRITASTCETSNNSDTILQPALYWLTAVPGASKGTPGDAKCLTKNPPGRGDKNKEVMGGGQNFCWCLCLKCSKTHLQASLIPKFSWGL